VVEKQQGPKKRPPCPHGPPGRRATRGPTASRHGLSAGGGFVDANGNHQYDPGTDTPEVGATIQLYSVVNNTPTLQTATTTGTDGSYQFSGLAAGVYQLKEIPAAGYVNDDVQILSQINPASKINSSTIQVTIPDPVNITYNGDATSLENATFTWFGQTFTDSQADQLSLTSNGQTFNSFCTDMPHTAIPGATFTVVPGPAPASDPNALATNAGRIGWLYNTFGTATLTDPAQSQGLQLAIWELVYDTTPDLSQGNFSVSSGVPGAIADAQNYLNLSAGKSEPAYFLNLPPGAPLVGGQGMIATGRLNFSNVPAVTVGDFVWNDVNANGLQDTGEAGIPGVTLTLTGTSSHSDTVFGSATPAVPAAADSNSVELGVKFTSDQAGYVTGLRFYKGAGNDGTHVGNLWTADGTLLATATFTGETADGWQEVNFATPVAITAGTTYIASYFAPQGHYAYSSNFFASGFDSAPLHVPSSVAAGGNGVYVYSTTSAFPGANFNANNYWVDVEFSPTVAVTDHATTDATGHYLFTEAPGTYTVTVDASNFAGGGALAGYTPTPTLQGSNRSVDSNPSPSGTTPGTLPGGASDTTVDFGYYKPDLRITKAPDSNSITAGQTAGYTVTITNTGTGPDTGVTLTDQLPLGSAAPNDLNWTIDTGTGDYKDFTITGAAGTQQSLTLSSYFIGTLGDTLAAGQSISVHVFTATTAGDGGGGGALASNQYGFNGTAIQFGSAPGGSYVWYSSHVAAQNMPTSGTVTFHVTNQHISLPSYTDPVTHATVAAQQLAVPNAEIIYTDTVTTATTTFTSGQWVTTVPLSYNGNVFFSGLAFPVPAHGLPGGIQPVTWAGSFTVDQTLTKVPSLQWQWGAAAYTTFDSTPGTPGFQDADYNALMVKPVDSNTLSAYQNSDHSGTPEGKIGTTPIKNYVIGGGSGGGGSNWTGSNSGTIKVTPTKGGGQLVNTASVTAGNVTFDADDTATATIMIAMPLVSADSGIVTSGDGVVGTDYSLAQGVLLVYVDNAQGNITTDEQARIDDAIAKYNTELAPYGLTLVEAGADEANLADITVNIADTTEIGGAAQGVLGVTRSSDHSITLVDGWNWYLGSDPSQIGADQYDFQTIATHELGHAIGLGHSPDTGSVMYPYLAAREVRRDLSASDLSLIDDNSGTVPEALLAAGDLSLMHQDQAGTPQPLLAPPAAKEAGDGTPAASLDSSPGAPLPGLAPAAATGHSATPQAGVSDGSAPAAWLQAAMPTWAIPVARVLDTESPTPLSALAPTSRPATGSQPAPLAVTAAAAPLSPAAAVRAPLWAPALGSWVTGEEDGNDSLPGPGPAGQQPQRPAAAPAPRGGPEAVPDNTDGAADLAVAARSRLAVVDARFAQDHEPPASPAVDGLSPLALAEQPGVTRSAMALAALLGFLGVPWKVPQEGPGKRRQLRCSRG
jgi:uncharacterized repeat protein (TIGR01451 family)